MGWDWLPVLSQKGLFLLWVLWEQEQHKLFHPHKAVGGNSGGFLILPHLHLRNGSRASDTRGKTGARSVSPSVSLPPTYTSSAASWFPILSAHWWRGGWGWGLLSEAVANPSAARGGCLALNCFLRRVAAQEP